MGLTEDQNKAFYYISQNKNLFITGPGGTGKSYLIKHIYNNLSNVVITAMTGTASLLLPNGNTLHNYLGIQTGEYDLDKLITIINKKNKVNNYINIKTLIIDEVSMLTAELFDKINALFQYFRGNNKPFGGIQILLFGDLYQLPPVEKHKGYIFEADTWNNSINDVIILKTNKRQENDNIFQELLNNIRIGKITQYQIDILNSKIIKNISDIDIDIKPTILYSKNIDVDNINNTELINLNNPIYKFKIKTEINNINYSSNDVANISKIIDNKFNIPENIELAINSQVMLSYNISSNQGLVNGSRGIIIDFKFGYPVVKFMNGIIISISPIEYCVNEYKGISRKQLPLKLAWATTIHKSQGLTIDACIINLLDTFECGQTYVALSRVKSLDGLYLLGFDPNKIKISKKVKKFMSKYV